MNKQPHQHSWKPHTKRLLLGRHARNNKRKESTATDTLLQWVCKCGKVSTYDMKRVIH